MKHISTPLFASLFLAGIASSQSHTPLWLPPGVSSSALSKVIDFSSNPLLKPLTGHPRPIYSCGLQKMPSDAPGEFTLTFSIRGLQGFGNPGFSGFLIAQWRPGQANPLSLTHFADGINEAYVDYNLELEPRQGKTGGRYAIFDRFFISGGLQYKGVFLASRSHDRANFGKGVQVANIKNSNGYADPALGYVGGKLKIFYAGRMQNSAGATVDGILMDDLLGAGTATPRAAGTPVLVAQPISRGAAAQRVCHSPSPVHGADGDVEGLILAEGDSPNGISEIYFAADLDPDTPHAMTEASKSWLSSGGIAGGQMLFTERANPQAPRVLDTAWLVGDEEVLGGTADITMGATGAQATALVYGGPLWLRKPLQLPGVIGSLGIQPFIRLGAGQIQNGDQTIHFSLKIPNAPGMRGVTIPLQGLATHSSGGQTIKVLTNTASIRIR